MRLATVVSVAPLVVRRDGDARDVSAKPTSVTVAAGDRVLTEIVDNLVYVIVRIA